MVVWWWAENIFIQTNDETFIFYEKLFNSIHESVIKGFLRFTHCKHCKRICICEYVCPTFYRIQTPFDAQLFLSISEPQQYYMNHEWTILNVLKPRHNKDKTECKREIMFSWSKFLLISVKIIKTLWSWRKFWKK